MENISPQTALRLYLLAHNLQNKALVHACTKLLCARIEETNVSEVWSAANATKNEILIGRVYPWWRKAGRCLERLDSSM
ncbi:unnamed protein product [Hymenolepis diminuta]|uniref:Uncharacterized protein n=1 Tax=Hymenolepis diminuta TaxID=6216 RepID=A0A564Y678_HYMDI|nr:unnamed protein product [Hymenolepis diminuta]